MAELSTLAVNGKAAVLTLNRPDARNALSLELLESLLRNCESLSYLQDVNVVTLRGEGKAFCAGMDLKAVMDSPADSSRLLFLLAELTIRLRKLPMISVASVHGAAIGGGCGLACVADICLSHADAKLGYPEVDLGVCPAVVAPWLAKKIGPGRARRVLLSGGVMSGAHAHAIGMVDQLAPDQSTLAALTDETIARLVSGGTLALRQTKDLLNRIDGSLNDDLVREGAKLSALVVQSAETQAMLRAKFA